MLILPDNSIRRVPCWRESPHGSSTVPPPFPARRQQTRSSACGSSGIDDRAGRKDDFHCDDRMVRIDCWPATHATRVIGQYTADCCGVNARGIRSHAAGVRFQYFVNTSKRGADIATNPRPVVLDLPAAPVLPHIDQDVVALRLAVQAGAAGPEGRVATFASAILKNRPLRHRCSLVVRPRSGYTDRGWHPMHSAPGR